MFFSSHMVSGGHLRVAQVQLGVRVVDAAGEVLLVPPVGEDLLAALAHHDRGAGVLAHRQHPARRDVRVLQQVTRDVAVVRRRLGVIQDGPQLPQVRGAQQVGDVPERGPAQQGQRLRVNFKKTSSERTLGYSSTVGDLPVGGVVVPKREQIGEGKLGHGPSLGPSGDPGRRDVGRVRNPAELAGVSLTSRLVWVSATLYGDGVRRRCDHAVPPSAIGNARHAVPPSAAAERSRRRIKLWDPCGRWASPTFPGFGVARGDDSPVPPAAGFARKAGVGSLSRLCHRERLASPPPPPPPPPRTPPPPRAPAFPRSRAPRAPRVPAPPAPPRAPRPAPRAPEPPRLSRLLRPHVSCTSYACWAADVFSGPLGLVARSPSSWVVGGVFLGCLSSSWVVWGAIRPEVHSLTPEGG